MNSKESFIYKEDSSSYSFKVISPIEDNKFDIKILNNGSKTENFERKFNFDEFVGQSNLFYSKVSS